MIRLNIRKEQLENEEEMLDIAISIFRLNRVSFYDNNVSETERLEKCLKYYNGVEPLTVFEKNNGYKTRVINFAKPIVDIASQTFIGELPNITTTINKNTEKDRISYFNQLLAKSGFAKAIKETAHYGSKCGRGILALFNEVGDKFPRFRELNPLFCDSVYSCDLAQEHLLSYLMIDDSVTEKGGIVRTYRNLYIYTKKRVYAYQTPVVRYGIANVPDANKDNVRPFNAWRTSNGKELAWVTHDFNDIPIIEFPNNAEYRGDAEVVFDLIAFYNDLINNRGRNVNDIVNYVLMIKNARLGDEEQQKSFLDMLENNHILALEGDNVEARFLTNALNQEQLQLLQNNVKDMIHYISRVPDLSSVDFSQNASDPIIKIKTKPLLDLCKQKEDYFTEPYMKALSMIIAFCQKNDSENFGKYKFDLDKCTLKYTHALPSNDNDMITMITNLSNCGLANPEVLLENLTFIPNVHDYIEGMKQYNEYVDKRKKEKENISKQEIVANETNLQRQNATPLTTAQMDNKSNFNKGNANTISEEKVE